MRKLTAQFIFFGLVLTGLLINYPKASLAQTLDTGTLTVKAYIGQDWNFCGGGGSCQFEGYINTCQASCRQFAKVPSCRPDGSGIGADGTVYFVGCRNANCGIVNWSSNNINWSDVCLPGAGCGAEILGTRYLSWTNQLSDVTFSTSYYYANGYKVFWKPSDPARNYNLCINAPYNPTLGSVAGSPVWHHAIITWANSTTNYTTAVFMPVYGAAATPTPTPIPSPTPIVIKACNQSCNGANECASGFCFGGVCRNVDCPTVTTCVCSGPCSCDKDGDVTTNTTPTPTPTPVPAVVNGRGTYIDINNNCLYDAGVDQTASGTTSYQLTQTSPVTCTYNQSSTSTNGSISFTGLGCFSTTNSATYRLNATYSDANYQFICAGSNSNSAQFTIGVTPGQIFDFSSALASRRNGWLQGYGAELYVNGSISDIIPSSLPVSEKVLIKSDATMEAGTVSLSNSTINLGGAPVSSKGWISTSYTQTIPSSTTYNGLFNTIINGNMVDQTYPAGNVSWPAATGSAYTDQVVVIRMQGNSTINADVNLNARYILFVEGNLTINNPIALGQQGFLLIVTRGSINVSAGLGTTPNSAAPTIEGLFIAGSNFVANGSGTYNDLRLNIKGTVVTGANGTGSYVSSRTHQQIAQYPSDYFIFNPKLLINAPKVLTSPIFSWNISRDE